MTIGYPNTAYRPAIQPWDRVPVVLVISYAGEVAPHGATVRASYTAPAAKLAIIDVAAIEVMRATPAGALDEYGAYLTFTPHLLTAGFPVDLTLRTNGVGDRAAYNLTPFGLMTEGDQLQFSSYDRCTTGTVLYNLGTKYTQFNV